MRNAHSQILLDHWRFERGETLAPRKADIEPRSIKDHLAFAFLLKRESDDDEDSTLLMDATMKSDMPPLALPTQEYMERAKKIWERLGLPALRPQAPWFGYSLGDWLPQWDAAAKRAATGGYLENGRISERQQKKGLKPETKFRPGE